MEVLNVPSQSFINKWVECDAGTEVQYELKPLKKSINFGIYRYKTGVKLPNSSEFSGSNLDETLTDIGMERIQWHSRCPAEQKLSGTVKVSDAGTIIFFFDNKFSKNTSKTVMFSHRSTVGNGRRPSLANAKIGSHLLSTKSSSGSSTQLASEEHESEGSSQANLSKEQSEVLDRIVAESQKSQRSTVISDGRFVEGILLKKRRKKLQGYTQRYFSLDIALGTLTYRQNRSSSTRGSMAIGLSVVSAQEKARDIFIDSGMEVWRLRARNNDDWKTWVQALELVRSSDETKSHHRSSAIVQNSPLLRKAIQNTASSSVAASPVALDSAKVLKASEEFHRDLEKVSKRVESMVTRLNKSDAQYGTEDLAVPELNLGDSPNSLPRTDVNSSLAPPPAQQPLVSAPIKRNGSFWKRSKDKGIANPANSTGDVSPFADAFTPPSPIHSKQQLSLASELDQLNVDLKMLVHKHSELSSEAFQIISSAAISPDQRAVSQLTQDNESDIFFDADEYLSTGVVYMSDGESDAADAVSDQTETDDENEAQGIVLGDGDDDDDDDDDSFEFLDVAAETGEEKRLQRVNTEVSLWPLPLSPVKYRKTIPFCNHTPPSIMGTLRKNIGKDMSTIAMPVTANEPLSALQKYAEIVEYSYLIDKALSYPEKSAERMIYITTFAMSYISGNRAKVRCTRKPFNPLLGETYELVSPERNLRLIAEKVCHRPVVIALQVEHHDWTLQYTASPKQKFYGKSMELVDPTHVRLLVNATGELIEFVMPTMYLRNMIAGEKYVEPVGSISVASSLGSTCVAEFKAETGMFAGRSESVTIYCPNEPNKKAEGKWTTGINFNGKQIWTPDPLVQGYEKQYGFNEFSVCLNEITEKDKAACPSDSRFRPDLRLYEEGDVDAADETKVQLEEAQRERRKALEESGKEHAPKFFELVEGTDRYTLKQNPSYWDQRRKGFERSTELW